MRGHRRGGRDGLAATEKTESDVSAATETVFSEGRSDSAPSPVPSEGADDAPSVESGDLASPMIPSMARSDASAACLPLRSRRCAASRADQQALVRQRGAPISSRPPASVKGPGFSL